LSLAASQRQQNLSMPALPSTNPQQKQQRYNPPAQNSTNWAPHRLPSAASGARLPGNFNGTSSAHQSSPPYGHVGAAAAADGASVRSHTPSGNSYYDYVKTAILDQVPSAAHLAQNVSDFRIWRLRF
jgi:hypothetical protein